ncbi:MULTISPECIES: pilus assembly protein TadG-related protein [unclassified Streptomyces]|uniref:pilus assembly protein TadG-related protein n=1 Tax=unclassified Streptomyces TaxID=2593676 RepID=UPI0037F324E5
MTKGFKSERGQAFPIYIVMVAGLLFLAFAFFAVGQASAARNGAQGAADAAALAAAQEARQEMGLPFLQALRGPNGLDGFLSGYQYFQSGRSEAEWIASRNHSDVTDFYWRPGFWQDKVTATVKTRYTVGTSVIPSTKSRHATASATAVVEFRCSLKSLPQLPAPGQGEDDGKGKGDSKDTPGPVEFSCDGRSVSIDLSDRDPLAGLSKLFFAVHLIDD